MTEFGTVTEVLQAAIEMLRLTPSGNTGPLDERIPWFKHGGVSHGADRPDCYVCQWLVAAEALVPHSVPAVVPTLADLRRMTPREVNQFLASIGATMRVVEPIAPAVVPTRAQVEQAFIDGSVAGSPIDHDGNPVVPAVVPDVETLAAWLHKHRFGCVSPYGTDETARRAYDRIVHQQDAADFAKVAKERHEP